jgi:hypothetical protein
MPEYKSNSHRSKEVRTTETSETSERKKIEKITNGKVKTKKKSEIHKFTDIFLAEDVTNVKDYILGEVLLPAVKKAVSDIVTNGIDMLLYGETRSHKKEKGSKVSYSKYYDRDRYDRSDRDRDRGSRRVRTGYDYEDVILETRGEAEDVLGRMEDLLDTYGVVSVADLYDLVGIQGDYTDNKYGWSNLRNADIQRLREGYLLKLSKALPLD